MIKYKVKLTQCHKIIRLLFRRRPLMKIFTHEFDLLSVKSSSFVFGQFWGTRDISDILFFFTLFLCSLKNKMFIFEFIICINLPIKKVRIYNKIDSVDVDHCNSTTKSPSPSIKRSFLCSLRLTCTPWHQDLL